MDSKLLLLSFLSISSDKHFSPYHFKLNFPLPVLCLKLKSRPYFLIWLSFLNCIYEVVCCSVSAGI